ncbi:MAG: 2-oxoacid:ferredoxin oxidoreductase subunit gamma [Desulfobacterales bacterium]|nr:2-oxoacid:ferredoxin oxidoreductase subunit gamma [Desulfobacterales bacterium]
MGDRYLEVIMSGVGGKGLLTLGKILAQAGVEAYDYVSFFPNYSPAMRGGESECTVVFSDNPIPSPLIYNPSHAIVMDSSSFTNFESRLKADGILFCDKAVAPEHRTRDDISVVEVPASEKAVELGNTQVANMVLLGAYVKKAGSVPIELLEDVVTKRFEGTRYESLLELNKKAIREGSSMDL